MRRTGPGGLDDLFDTLKDLSKRKDPHAGMDTGNIDDQNGGGNNGGKRFKLPALRIPAGLIVSVLLAAYLSQGCWYSLDEDNYAVVTTLGKPETVAQAGLHFKLPILQQVTKVSKVIMGMPIGYVQETDMTIPEEAIMITKDFNFVNTDFYLEYMVSDPVKYYILAIVDATRKSERLRLGVSPRGSLALMKASQAWAAMSGRDYVIPDDVKKVAVPVLSHRIITRSQNTIRLTDTNEQVIEAIVDTVKAPVD